MESELKTTLEVWFWGKHVDADATQTARALAEFLLQHYDITPKS